MTNLVGILPELREAILPNAVLQDLPLEDQALAVGLRRIRALADSGDLPQDQAQIICLVLTIPSIGGELVRGNFEKALDWMNRGFGGDGSNVSRVELEGLRQLQERALADDGEARASFVQFAHAIFAMDGIAGYAAETLEHLGEDLAASVLVLPPSVAISAVIPHILGWVRKTARDKLRGYCLAWIAAKLQGPVSPEEHARLYFSIFPELPLVERSALAAEYFAEFHPEISANIGLQILGLACEDRFPNEIWDFSLIFQLVSRARPQESGDAASFSAAAERSLHLLLPVVIAAAREDRQREAVELLQAWFGVEDEPDVSLLMVVHEAEGIRYCWPGGSYFIARTPRMQKLASALNAALGLAVVANTGDSLPLAVAASGNLDASSGLLLRDEAIHELGLPKPELGQQEIKDCKLMITLPNMGIPYQSILQAGLGFSPAIWSSLESPKEEKFYERILLVDGQSGTSTRECDIVADIFESDQREVTRWNGDGSSFLQAYESGDFDMVWVAGHAVQNPYDEAGAYVQIQQGERVSRLEMLNVQHRPSQEARLLILNSCQVGATVSAGGPHRRGLAAECARGDQIVISHQWEINENVALVFACLLAAGIVKTHEAAIAFSDALDAMEGGEGAVLAKLRDHGHPDLAHAMAELYRPYEGNPLYHAAPILYR